MNITSLTSTELLVTKQPLISILSNGGSSYSSSSNLSIPSSSSGWSANTVVLDASTCQTYTTGSDGSLSIGISSGQPRILLADSIKGTLCTSGVAAQDVFDSTASTGGSSSGKKSGGKVTRGVSVVLAASGMMGVAVSRLME